MQDSFGSFRNGVLPAPATPGASLIGGGGDGGEVGSGSPEGVVTAEPGMTYYDTTNDQLWIKASGSGNTGWDPY